MLTQRVSRPQFLTGDTLTKASGPQGAIEGLDAVESAPQRGSKYVGGRAGADIGPTGNLSKILAKTGRRGLVVPTSKLMSRWAPLCALVLAGALSVALIPGPAAAAGAGKGCNMVAASSGSDSAPGTVSAPFRTVQKLADSLRPGQIGCVRAGTYSEDVTIAHGGTSSSQILLTSYPGETATITGRFWVTQQASYVTISKLALDGRNSDDLPSPTINGSNITFSLDDITNEHTAICFNIGSDSGYGVANNTLITHSRIHGCGVLPANNHEHGIYIDDANGTRIEWNLIYDNADRAIQLYPNSQGATIDHNVIDDNGEGIIFSGDDGMASSNNNVYANLLTGATIRHDAESYYPEGNPLGTRNSLHNNCVWGGKEGTIDTSGGGFSASHNLTANPQYVNAAMHDYRLNPSSPCLSMTGDIAAAVGSSAPTQQPRAVQRPRRTRRHAVGALSGGSHWRYAR